MADRTTRVIARQSRELREREIPPHVREAATTRLVDALGCATGGFGSPPAQVASRLAERASGTPAARVLGSGTVTSVEDAAFANGVMCRYLDYNDTYTGRSSGHPSDMVPALLAVAESVHASGDALLRAVVCAYEVYGVIARSTSLRSRGWDQGLLACLGTTAGACLLLGLDQERTEHALALAATGVPTRSTRAGALSMWKGCATAASARLGVFATLLAAEGMTGPDRPVEGKDGLWQRVTGEFAVRPFGDPHPWVVTETSIKLYPLEYHAQIPVELMREVRASLSPSDIAGIHVDTYWTAFDEIGNDPEKWAPATRETADHSLPYLLAVALLEGEVTPASFDEAHLADPRIAEVVRMVTVSEDEDFTARWPDELPGRLTVTTRAGERITLHRDHPLGHPRRPLPPEEVDAKFVRLAASLLGEERAVAASARLRAAGDIPDATRLVDLFIAR